jgi:hypothetical protein
MNLIFSLKIGEFEEIIAFNLGNDKVEGTNTFYLSP